MNWRQTIQTDITKFKMVIAVMMMIYICANWCLHFGCNKEQCHIWSHILHRFSWGHLVIRGAKSGRSDISLLFFGAGANFWALHARTRANITRGVSNIDMITSGISTSAIITNVIFFCLISFGVNKNKLTFYFYAWFYWYSMLFCRHYLAIFGADFLGPKLYLWFSNRFLHLCW